MTVNNPKLHFIFALALFFSSAASADQSPAIDLQNGEDINELCAGCHGLEGQGGKQGEYPRLAGMPAEFIARQLRLFRARERPNLAMLQYVDHRQMPDPDIADISAFLSRIKLPTKLPPADPEAPDFNAFERLRQAERLMQIPRAPGDVEAGKAIYAKECASCHGGEGWGDNEQAVPQLAGQYTNYLWRQIDKYIRGVRIHDPEDPEYRLLAEFSQEELRDVLAYLSTADD